MRTSPLAQKPTAGRVLGGGVSRRKRRSTGTKVPLESTWRLEDGFGAVVPHEMGRWRYYAKLQRHRKKLQKESYVPPPWPRENIPKLVKAGVKQEPSWWAACQAVPPRLNKRTHEKTPLKLTYKEDRLREQFFEVYPEARHAPVHARARSMLNRHVSDKFVYNQMRLMKEGLTEKEAFKLVQGNFKEDLDDAIKGERDMFSKLRHPGLRDYYTKVFLTSWSESSRDKYLYQNISGKQPRGVNITLDDILSPGFNSEADPEESSDADGGDQEAEGKTSA